jgi:predicted DsbA family dithiol-disulfide isomerase
LLLLSKSGFGIAPWPTIRTENRMKSKAIFYHAGCPVCITAEHSLASAIDPARYEVEVVHLGTDPGRLDEAQAFGVESVPALVVDGTAFHINFGAGIDALR